MDVLVPVWTGADGWLEHPECGKGGLLPEYPSRSSVFHAQPGDPQPTKILHRVQSARSGRAAVPADIVPMGRPRALPPTPEQLARMRELRMRCWRLKEIAVDVGVSYSTVRRYTLDILHPRALPNASTQQTGWRAYYGSARNQGAR